MSEPANRELLEPVLEDDYLVHLGYLYACDGEVIECPLFNMDGYPDQTVRDLKRAMNACDAVGRGIEFF
jgi:hypothetical protein